MARLKQKYEGKIVFLSLTVEETDTPETIAAKFPATLHYAKASDAAWVSLTNMGGMRKVVPTHALIRADGSLQEVLEGAGKIEEPVARLVP